MPTMQCELSRPILFLLLFTAVVAVLGVVAVSCRSEQSRQTLDLSTFSRQRPWRVLGQYSVVAFVASLLSSLSVSSWPHAPHELGHTPGREGPIAGPLLVDLTQRTESRRRLVSAALALGLGSIPEYGPLGPMSVHSIGRLLRRRCILVVSWCALWRSKNPLVC